MTDLTTLADRIEAGTVEMQRELLEAAYLALHPEPTRTSRRGVEWQEWADGYNRFFDMAKASAYVDAAMMLVPEWCGVMLLCFADKKSGEAQVGSSRGRKAATPALALAACAIRAHASEATNV